MTTRPNKNLILQYMRDGDFGDPWGTVMAWGFACAENLHAASFEVPEQMQYRPSPFGAVIESYEDFEIQSMLLSGEVTATDVAFAGKCIARYLDWLQEAGYDY